MAKQEAACVLFTGTEIAQIAHLSFTRDPFIVRNKMKLPSTVARWRHCGKLP
jgi:hypothetical protein